MKRFIRTYGRRNIITYPKLKHKILKFWFITIRTNVTNDTIKVINRNKFRNISIPRGRSNHRFWFLPQQRTIWSKVTNNTKKMTCRHKNKFLLHSSSRFRLRFTNFYYINSGFFCYYVKKPNFGLECVWLLIRKLLVGAFFCILCVGLPSAVIGPRMLSNGVETSPVATHPVLVCAQTMSRLSGMCLRQTELFQGSHGRQT